MITPAEAFALFVAGPSLVVVGLLAFAHFNPEGF